jgi:hypothetical protein
MPTDTLDLEPVSNISREELEAELEQFSVEKEDDGSGSLMDQPFNPADINIKRDTLNLDNLIKRLRNNEIDLAPEFQRSMNLWENDKQSQLIESILIRFPLPAFYFDGTDDDRWLVVDGLQRISTINNFVVEKTLRLTGLEFLTKLQGKGFDDLPRPYQRQIEEASIIAYIINPGTPPEVKFNIFKRINTGGLILTPQEIRHALNQGAPAQFVKKLADLPEFKSATQGVVKTTRMEDRDFVTRFLAFYLTKPEDYKPDLDTFLNTAMGSLVPLFKDVDKAKQIEADFTAAMVLAKELFDRYAFRKLYNLRDRRKPISKAVFDVWSVSLAKLTPAEREVLRSRKEQVVSAFMELMKTDERFEASVSTSTSNKDKVVYRFSTIHQLIQSIVTGL